MKLNRILLCSLALTLMWSCDDNKMEWGLDPDKQPITEEELPNAEGEDDDVVLNEEYGLKDYIPEGSDFKLGIGMGMTLYTSANEERFSQLANENFNNIAAGYNMKHGPMVDNTTGDIKESSLTAFFDLTEQNNMPIFGHCLIWHSNQNATYLNSVLEDVKEETPTPEPEPEEPEEGNESKILINTNFQTGDYEGWYGWTSKGATKEQQVLNQNDDYYLELECTATSTSDTPDFYHCQFACNFSDSYILEKGKKYKLSFRAKSLLGSNIQLIVQNSTGSNGLWYKEVDLTDSWQSFEYELTYDKEYTDISRFVFAFGKNIDSYYFDDVKFELNEQVSSSIQLSRASTPSAIETRFKQEMEDWITEMINYCYDERGVIAWDVVNEPMEDGNLKSIILKTTPGEDVPNDAFYWQDCFDDPKDYAYWAFRYAREAFENKDVTEPKLFINDYNLEIFEGKCQQLIEYVKYIETLNYDGEHCQVDGIATQMHIGIDTNKDGIRRMFELLNNSGKLIKISELDVRLGDAEHNAENFKKQADMYEYVIDTYFEIIRPEQQYGITIWSLTDGEIEHEYWLPGDAPNLWDAEFKPKEAYYSVAKALARHFGTGESSESSESTESEE